MNQITSQNSNLVSIIVPNYNHASFLQQRIESILNQTYHNFELIILDDCSTDNSKEIIEQYRNHPKVAKILYNDNNGGNTFKQWQKGIDLAQGEYIWIAESDDWCEASFLQTVLAPIHSNSNIVLSYCYSLCIRDNKVISTSQLFDFDKIHDGKHFIEERLTKNNVINNASMAIFSKRAYSKIDNHFIHYKFLGDWIFWISIAQQGDVYESGRMLNYFRKHDTDVSGNAYNSGLFQKEYLNVQQYFLRTHLTNEKTYYTKLYHQYKKIKRLAKSNSSFLPILKEYRYEIGTSHLVRFSILHFLYKPYRALRLIIN